MKYRGTKPAFHDVRHLHNDEELTVEGGKNEGVKNRQVRKYLKSTGHKGKTLRKSMHTLRKDGLDELIATDYNAARSLSGPGSPVELSQEQRDRLYPSTAEMPQVKRNRELSKEFTHGELHGVTPAVKAAAGTTFKVTETKPADNTVATKENEEDND